MPSRRFDLGIIALLVFIWGTTWAAIRIGLEGIPPFAGASMRFGIAALVLFVVVKVKGIALGRERREWWIWLGNGLFSFVGSYGLVYWAEQWVPSGLAAVIFATYTLFVAILAHFFLDGDRLTGASTLGVLIGFVGVATLYSEELTTVSVGTVAEGQIAGIPAAVVLLGSPLCAALGQIVVKRWGEGLHPLSIITVPMFLTAVVLGGLSALFERGRGFEFTAATVGSVVYLGLVGSALAFTLFFWLLGRMKATSLSLIAYLTPVVAVLLGLVLFDEPLTPRILLGTVAVMAGVGLAARPKRELLDAPRHTE